MKKTLLRSLKHCPPKAKSYEGQAMVVVAVIPMLVAVMAKKTTTMKLMMALLRSLEHCPPKAKSYEGQVMMMT
jgi:DNA mismatch repair ATPase MutL